MKHSFLHRCRSALFTGKVTAFDGGSAAGKIAKQFADSWKKIRFDKGFSEKN
jgi:hypothetical protein